MQLAGKMDGEIVTVMQEDPVQEKRMPPPQSEGHSMVQCKQCGQRCEF